MRRQILKRKNIASGQRNDTFSLRPSHQFAVRLDHGYELIRSFVVPDDKDERAVRGSLQHRNQKGFSRKREPGDTDPSRVGSKVGYNTREGWELLRIRKQIADERQNHRFL